jgi:hypothetical protein
MAAQSASRRELVTEVARALELMNGEPGIALELATAHWRLLSEGGGGVGDRLVSMGRLRWRVSAK